MPITPEEVPFLEALGAEMRALRDSLGLSRPKLGELASLSGRHLESLEAGARRTRRTTLERIVSALVAVGGDSDAEAAELLEHLLIVGGPAVAGESEYSERVARRRARRERKTDKKRDQDVRAALDIARDLTAAAIAEHERSGRWPEWVRRRIT